MPKISRRTDRRSHRSIPPSQQKAITTIRLRDALLYDLDLMAEDQNRTRSNLIESVLIDATREFRRENGLRARKMDDYVSVNQDDIMR